MQREEAIQKVKKEFEDADLFQRDQTPADHKKIETLLGMLYSIAYNEGKRQYAHQKPVAQYDMDGNFIKVFGSVTIAARHVNRDKSALARAAKGESEFCGGYKWKYATNENSN